jgi:hypothetical protein
MVKKTTYSSIMYLANEWPTQASFGPRRLDWPGWATRFGGTLLVILSTIPKSSNVPHIRAAYFGEFDRFGANWPKVLMGGWQWPARWGRPLVCEVLYKIKNYRDPMSPYARLIEAG